MTKLIYKLKIQNSWTKTVIFILILAFYASIVTHKIALPVYDDLPRQIKIGEEVLSGNFDIIYKNVFSYTEPEQTFYNHHWLSGVWFYLLFGILGWSGLVVFKVVILLLFFSILFFTALKRSNFWVVSVVSVPTILILAERTGLRPEIFSYLFISIFLYILFSFEEKPQSKKIFWLIPLQLLWVNMHVLFSIGIMLVGGFFFEKLVHNYRDLKNDFKNTIKNNEIIRKLGITLLGVILVSFINPRGIDGVFYRYVQDFPAVISEFMTLHDFEKGISLWTNVSINVFKISTILLLFSFCLFFYKKSKNISLEKFPIFFIITSISSVIIGYIILRGITLFAIIFFVVFGSNMNEFFIGIKEKYIIKHKKIFTLPLILFTIFLFLLSMPFTRLKVSPHTEFGAGLTKWSNSSIDFFNKNSLKGSIFNDPDIGSYLIYHLYPKEKVFVDNRFGDAYSSEFFREVYFASLDSEDVWLEVSKKYDFQTIFFYQYDRASNIRNFLWRRLNDPAWSLVYVDMYTVIFIRNLPENKDVLDKFEITRENIGERLGHLKDSKNYDDLVTFADIANLIGREDLGADTFLKIVYKWPEDRTVWMIMGEWELAKNQYRNHLLSMMYLEKAISLGQRSAESYTFLGIVYDKLQQKEKAIEALEKALKINPDRRDAKDLLYQLTGNTTPN